MRLEEKEIAMCYDIAQLERAKEKYELHYGVKTTPQGILIDNYHVKAFAYPPCNVITQQEPTVLQQFEWCLIPWWVKNEEEAERLRKQLANARSETIFEKAAFRDSIFTKRCIIPVTGFFEWHTRPDGKKKIPFFVYMKDNELFSIAGIYDRWVNKMTGEVKHTFAVITTDANEMMAHIHNTKLRMPVILPPDKECDWLSDNLSRQQIIEYMKPLPSELMTAHTISKRITDRKLDDNVPEVIEPYVYPELVEGGGLFDVPAQQ